MSTELLEKPPIPPSPPEEDDAAGERTKESKRRIRNAALQRGMVRLLTRTNAANLALVVLLSIVAVIFLLSLVQAGIGNFTISLNRTDMYKYGIEIADNSGFVSATSRLEADALTRATNISVNDLPQDLDELDGSHNGDHYIAYTFYVRNNGTADFDYKYQIRIIDVERNLDTAMRVAVYYNGGNRQVFAKKASDGSIEPGTVPFATDKVIDAGTIMDMSIGSVDKYTIVIWIEGDDPDCTDDLLGGMIKMDMFIDIIEPES